MPTVTSVPVSGSKNVVLEDTATSLPVGVDSLSKALMPKLPTKRPPVPIGQPGILGLAMPPTFTTDPSSVYDGPAGSAKLPASPMTSPTKVVVAPGMQSGSVQMYEPAAPRSSTPGTTDDAVPTNVPVVELEPVTVVPADTNVPTPPARSTGVPNTS